jgi:hypothetical protein
MVGNGDDMVLISVGASSVPPTPGEIFQLPQPKRRSVATIQIVVW